ncbi:hypothetical protein [Sulfurimonas sp.]|uniref:hypothetical protein n=1 Tax=Sulfurimonas sp. TaxID=2022749 RepID=UPI0035637110
MISQSKKHFVDNNLNNYFGDTRILELLKYDKKGQFKCVYCYEKADSREHLPSKVFLDEPYPTNLAILPSCTICNNSYSEDEQYLACLIDYVQYKLHNLETLKRSKIQRAFNARPNIKNEFENSTKYANNGNIDYIQYDDDRIKNILLKLSIGHATYSLSSIHLDEPSVINYKFATELTQEESTSFNLEPICDVIPELGSREGTYISVLDDGTPITTWKIIQDGQYRFLAYQNKSSINIRIVIGEYFYSEVIWN